VRHPALPFFSYFAHSCVCPLLQGPFYSTKNQDADEDTAIQVRSAKGKTAATATAETGHLLLEDVLCYIASSDTR
jgi:hypothetical protein